MGKQSKRIHRWCVYLQDLRAELARCEEGKFAGHEEQAASVTKVIAAVTKKYGTSVKSPLK